METSPDLRLSAQWEIQRQRIDARDAGPLSAKDVITEPPDLSEEQRAVLRAFRETQVAYWRALAWLASEAVIVVPPNIGLPQQDSALRDALDRVRGWQPPYVDYGRPSDEVEASDALEVMFRDGYQNAPNGNDIYWDGGMLTEFFYRRLDVGGAVLSRNLPEHVLLALERCRKTYVMGCADATVALCRCVMDAAAHQWLVEDGWSPGTDRSKVTWNVYEIELATRRRDVKGLLREVSRVRTLANGILHPQHSKGFANEDALLALRITFQFVERLLGKG